MVHIPLKSHKKNKFKVRHGVFTFVAAVLIITVVSSTYFFYRPNSRAQVPSSPTLSDVCDATTPSDIEVANVTLPNPTSIIQHVIVPTTNTGISTFHLVNIGGVEEIYVLADKNSSRSISVYNLATGTLINSFPVSITGNSADSFALDPQGNVYVIDDISTQALYKYSPTGSVLWKVSTPGGSDGAYGYTDQNGNFNVAFISSGGIKGSASYDQTGSSNVYNQAGVKQPNNNMLITGDADQDATSGDILSFNNGMFRVYTNSGTLKFQMGTNLNPGGSGPWHFYVPGGASENPSGGYYISDAGHGIESFDQNGGYLGISQIFKLKTVLTIQLAMAPATQLSMTAICIIT